MSKMGAAIHELYFANVPPLVSVHDMDRLFRSFGGNGRSRVVRFTCKHPPVLLFFFSVINNSWDVIQAFDYTRREVREAKRLTELWHIEIHRPPCGNYQD